MKDERLYYIELKSGRGDSGPAWISCVNWSKSGRTLYFNGHALKRSGRYLGNFSCLETDDKYWVSGVKENRWDRHWAGGGPVMVDSHVAEKCRSYRGVTELNPALHSIVTGIAEPDISKINEIENRESESS